VFLNRSLILAAVCAALVLAPMPGAAGGDAPPELKAPRKIYVLAGETIAFDVFATDPEGGDVVISVASAPLPGSEFTDRGGEGTYQITADPALAGTTQTVVFQAVDAAGGTATASTELCILLPRGSNPPRLTVPGDMDELDKRVSSPPVFAPAGQTTEVFVEVVDPEGDPVTLELASDGGIGAALEPTEDPGYFKLSVSPARRQRGQMIPLSLTAMDSQGATTTKTTLIDVPAAGAEVDNLAVWWDPPPAGDPFEPPVDIEVFATGGATTRTPTTENTNGLLGYAIYASTTPDFEPSEENLVELAVPTALRGNVVLPRPAGGSPWFFKVTSRRVEGESTGSDLAATDVPRVTTATFRRGKLAIVAHGSNVLPGAAVEVRTNPAEPGVRFPLAANRQGTRWVVRKNAVGEPGGVRPRDVLERGVEVVLVIHNPNEKASQPFAFTP
jgi:hypothetical protein